MKAVKAKLQDTNPGAVEEFEKGAQAFAKKLVANFKDYEFVSQHPCHLRFGLTAFVIQYTGEKMDPDGMVALLNYREDGVTRTSNFPLPMAYGVLTDLFQPTSHSGSTVSSRSSCNLSFRSFVSFGGLLSQYRE